MEYKPELLPIADDNLDDVYSFLAKNHNLPVTLKTWRETFNCKWIENKPNNGFMYKIGDNIVGVLVALYSDQFKNNKKYQLCNLCTWYVLKKYKNLSLKLIHHILSQKEFNYTTLTMDPRLIRLHKSFKFSSFSNTDFLYIPHYPKVFPTSYGLKYYSNLSDIQSILSLEALKVSQHHETLRLVNQIAISDSNSSCLIMYIGGFARNLHYANIIYISDPDFYYKYSFSVGSYLLLKKYKLYTRVLKSHLSHVPLISLKVQSRSSMMYRGESIDGEHPQEIYSESVLGAFIAPFSKDSLGCN